MSYEEVCKLCPHYRATDDEAGAVATWSVGKDCLKMAENYYWWCVRDAMMKVWLTEDDEFPPFSDCLYAIEMLMMRDAKCARQGGHDEP
jgi:hypothetical protein